METCVETIKSFNCSDIRFYEIVTQSPLRHYKIWKNTESYQQLTVTLPDGHIQGGTVYTFY